MTHHQPSHPQEHSVEPWHYIVIALAILAALIIGVVKLVRRR